MLDLVGHGGLYCASCRRMRASGVLHVGDEREDVAAELLRVRRTRVRRRWKRARAGPAARARPRQASRPRPRGAGPRRPMRARSTRPGGGARRGAACSASSTRPRPPARRALRGPARLERAPGPPRQRAPPLRRGALRGHPPALRPAPGRRRASASTRSTSGTSLLERELVAHVQDLARRIDLVLAEADRGRPAPGARRSRTCARGSRGSRRRCGGGHEDRPRVRRPGALRHRGRRDPRPRAGLSPRRGAASGRTWWRCPSTPTRPPRWCARRSPGGSSSCGRRTGESVDLVIPTKFPSYLVPAPRKVAWLFHQHREAYDLLRHAARLLRRRPRGPARARGRSTRWTPRRLGECQRVFTISRNVADRLARYNGLAGTPLHPPPQHLGRYRTDGYGDYLFYAGRLEPHQAGGPRAARARREHERGAAEDRRAGLAARATCARLAATLGVGDARGLPRLRLRRGAASPSTPAAARRLRARRTRTTAT